MNGGPGIEKGCLLVFFVIGARTAIVNVLTILETQNLEPNRTILLFTQLPMLLPPLLRQICCRFHDPRAQPNLQPPEMRPDPHEGAESAKAKLFLKRQEPHITTPNTLVRPPPKILFFFTISGAQKRGIRFFRRPTTLSAITRAVDGVEQRLFNPSHPTLPCAFIGYSISAL
jgi:hypothetical protein